MANRVSVAELKDIIDLDTTLTDAMITVFITSANRIINKVITSTSMTETDKKDVEMWLAAHFVAIRDTRSASETAGPVSQSVQYQLGLGLNVTMYGQQAMLLDSSGALARLNRTSQEGGAIAASLEWLGKEDDE